MGSAVQITQWLESTARMQPIDLECDEWDCSACTFRNAEAEQCAMCGTARRREAPSGTCAIVAQPKRKADSEMRGSN